MSDCIGELNTESQELDFFQEALKAFDAPLPKDMPKAVETVSAVAAEAAPIPVEEALPPRPSVLKKWWPALLCCLVCVALLATLLPLGSRYEVRSENWIYGTISFAHEDILVVKDRSDERWYVQCEGIALPEEYQLDITEVWVFYDDEPRETTELNCAYKIEATLIKTPYVQRIDALEDYGYVYDDIHFDLDGDGKVEHWYLCGGYSFGLLPPLLNSSLSSSVSPWYSSSSVLLNQYRLLALDDAGNELHHIRFESVSHLPHVFGNHDNRLTLTALTASGHATVDIRMEDGEVALYHEEKRLITTPMLNPDRGDILMTVEPTLVPASEPAICFSIQNGASTGWITGKADTVAKFKKTLDGLQTESTDRYPGLDAFGSLQIRIDGQVHDYQFTADGKLIQDRTVRQMGEGLFMDMIVLMGHPAEKPQGYAGRLSPQESLSLDLESGEFRLEIKKSIVDFKVAYGSYGQIGDYLILSNGYEKNNKASFVYVFQNVDGELTFCPELSVMSEEWDLKHQVKLLNRDVLGARMQVGLGGAEYDEDISKTGVFFLEPSAAQTLKEQLDSEKWWSDSRVNTWTPMGYFLLHDAIDMQHAAPWDEDIYYISPTWNIFRNGKYCTPGPELISLLASYINLHGEGETFMKGVYPCQDAQGRTISFQFMDEKVYYCTVSGNDGYMFGGSNTTSGRYLVLGDKLLLYRATTGGGITMVFRIDGDTLVYDRELTGNRSFDIADGTVLRCQGSGMWVRLTCQPPVAPGNQTVRYETDYCEIKTSVAKDLTKLLEDLQWSAAGQYDANYLFVYIRIGEETLQFSINGNRKVRQGYREATLTEEQWGVLLRAMDVASQPVSKLTVYHTAKAGVLYTLLLNSDNTFTYTEGDFEALGHYIHVGNTFCFFMADGNTFMMLEDEEGKLTLEPVTAPESMRHLEGLVFSDQILYG